jgi:hypothetical protein
MAEEIVRAVRLVEYVGPKAWVNDTLGRMAIQGKREFRHGQTPCWVISTLTGEPRRLTPEELAHYG